MSTVFEKRELQVLTEVLKEYLTELRTEILEASEEGDRKVLEEKQETLRGILAELEKPRTPGVRERAK